MSIAQSVERIARIALKSTNGFLPSTGALSEISPPVAATTTAKSLTALERAELTDFAESPF